jgi:hypothetical protein
VKLDGGNGRRWRKSARPGSGGAGETKELTSGAHLSVAVRGGEGGMTRRRKPKGKTHSCDGAMGNAGLLGRVREAKAQEGVDLLGQIQKKV